MLFHLEFPSEGAEVMENSSAQLADELKPDIYRLLHLP